MIHQLEVLAPDKDFITRRSQRFLQTEELRICRKVDRTGAALSPQSDFVSAVADQLARNFELRRCAERIFGSQLFCGDRVSVDEQLVAECWLQFTALL